MDSQWWSFRQSVPATQRQPALGYDIEVVSAVNCQPLGVVERPVRLCGTFCSSSAIDGDLSDSPASEIDATDYDSVESPV